MRVAGRRRGASQGRRRCGMRRSDTSKRPRAPAAAPFGVPGEPENGGAAPMPLGARPSIALHMPAADGARDEALSRASRSDTPDRQAPLMAAGARAPSAIWADLPRCFTRRVPATGWLHLNALRSSALKWTSRKICTALYVPPPGEPMQMTSGSVQRVPLEGSRRRQGCPAHQPCAVAWPIICHPHLHVQ